MTMRCFPLLIPALLLLQACSGGSAPDAQAPVVERDTVPAPPPPFMHADWTGIYEGTAMAEDGGERRVTLWLRSSGTYVRADRPSGGQGVPEGRIGYWNVADEALVLVDAQATMPQRWERTEGRLVPAVPVRRSQGAAAGPVLERTAGDADARTPPLRVFGLHRVMGESQALEPCGAGRVLPLAVGDQLAALQALRQQAGLSDDEPLLMDLVVEVGMAGAMEGDEQDEYLWLMAAPRAPGGRSCP